VNNNRNRSPLFKQFLKALQKPKRFQRDKMPNTKQLLACPEYANFERKQEVQCEITCLDFKTGSTESLRFFVFRFSKNEKGEKKSRQDYEGMTLLQNEFQKHNEPAYQEFKAVSIAEESKDEMDLQARERLMSSDIKKTGQFNDG